MTAPGQLVTVFTFILMIAAIGSLLVRRPGMTTAWMGTRSLYFLFGVIISAVYLRFVSTTSNTTGQNISSPYSFQDFLPMIISIIGLVMSWVAHRAGRNSNPGYGELVNNDDVIFRDGGSGL